MSVTLHLERSMPGKTMSVQDRHVDWSIVLDGEVVGTIASDEVFEREVSLGEHTLGLTSTGKRRSPVRTFSMLKDDSMVEFRCHSQPVWPLMLMALVVPGHWIALKQL